MADEDVVVEKDKKEKQKEEKEKADKEAEQEKVKKEAEQEKVKKEAEQERVRKEAEQERVRREEKETSEQWKPVETGRHNSPMKKRTTSKTYTSSKMSLRRHGESIQSISNASSSSFIVKRPSSIEKMVKGPRYQNTYRLDSKKPFKAHEVYKVLEAIVLREVEGWSHYDFPNGQRMVQAISVDARNAIKQMNYDRYKICVLVYLGEKKLQGFQASFRALWDPERDGWSTFFYQCRTYFVSCTCFAVYHD